MTSLQATSALDTENERFVQQALEKLVRTFWRSIDLMLKRICRPKEEALS